MSNALRGVIFESYRQDPTTNTARAISGRYGISIARVEAIIRLKTLEASWKEVRIRFTFFSVPSLVMRKQKRLVFKTKIMVINFCMHGFLNRLVFQLLSLKPRTDVFRLVR